MNGIHFNSRFKIKTAFLNSSIKINVSNGDWCLDAMIKGCLGMFSIPLTSYLMPHNKRSMNNTTLNEQTRKMVITHSEKKITGRVMKV
nr:hypothetical protein [Wolbachia endosymbiont of Ceratosolen solmsi]